ncbi:uncharacterized protein JCM15063_003860 [Sporobolomyces koalae]|uniref:uncharacterized protein n=1 Tax=Sporobolomyces koalae TaxID=500713 RepID=UPI00316FB286
MGISGLLPLLKEIAKPCHVKEWKDKTLAVDAYVWLHRGAYGCAQELALGKPTIKYVNYAMNKIRMLRYFGVTPFVVFDGGLLPSKMGTEEDREKKRTEALARGNALLAEGKATQARDAFVKAVDVTPAMAYQLIKALRQEGIQYVVAPYEADPQLAYLEKCGLVDGIITEDSDLLVFGCKNVLFKLDGEGNCVSIARDDFSSCREYNFSDWSDKEFRQMAILSGCDYLESIVGLGLKTAYRLMRKYKTAEKVVQFVRLEGNLTVPRDYLVGFERAELTFQHQRVFDPVHRQLVHFCPLPSGKSAADMPFVGAELDVEYARGVANGDIDPLSKVAMIDLMPDSFAKTTNQRTTYKPSPATSSFYRGKGPSKPSPKDPVQPAKGAASILSFFSRAPATPSGSNTVKQGASRDKARLVTGEAKENNNKAKVASPQRKSKFFGSSTKIGSSEVKISSVKAPEKVDEALADEELDMIILEQERQALQQEEGEDEDAEMALCEVEMRVGADAGADGHGLGLADATERDAATPDDEDDSSPHSPSLDICLSSPLATPAQRAQARAITPVAETPLLESEDGPAVSSPVSSAHADAGWDDPNLSSPPVARPSSPLPRNRGLTIATAFAAPNQGPTPPNRIKIEKSAGTAINAAKTEFIELSSDPIDLTNSEDNDPDTSTPRPTASISRPPREGSRPVQTISTFSQEKKPFLSRSKTKPSVEIRPDEPIRSSVKGKGKRPSPTQIEESDEDVEAAAAVKTVAASWRAKFMLQNSSSTRTPRPKTDVRPSKPTPDTTCRPPSREKPLAGRSSPRKASLADNSRIPLSPRPTNRTSGTKPAPSEGKAQTARLVADDSCPSPKRRKSSSTSPFLSDDMAPLHLHEGSSSPVIITNPKLLAFRFRGSPNASS